MQIGFIRRQKTNYTHLDSVLKYLPSEEHTGKEKSLENSTLEVKVEQADEITEIGGEELPSLRYLPLTTALPEFAYGKAEHDPVIYSFKPFLKEEEQYQITSPKNDTYDAELPIDEEAKEDLQESKYEFIVSPVNVDYETKQKLRNWILFHPADFAFFESVHGLSREANY